MRSKKPTITNHGGTQSGQEGFTIIELMIATAVLSTILVMVTVVMVNIGNLYYKGINQARVQDDVRSISDEIIKNIQLNDQPPVGPVPVPGVSNSFAYCVGSVRYTYVLGAQIGKPAPGTSTPYYQVLWRDNNPTPGSCPTQVDPTDPSSPQVNLRSPNLAADDAANQGAELITSNSRLTEFSMTAGSPSIVTVAVAYGDDDLLCNPAKVSGSCNTAAAMLNWASYSGNVLCKGHKGDQFCSTARLTGSAVKRVAGGSF